MTDFTRISCQQANELCALEATQIIDVRDAAAYNEAHIKGAVHIDNASLTAYVEQADRDTALVIYCYHGNASQQASQFFIQQDFTAVYSVNGGFEQWRNELPEDLAT
tara:strand:- start:190 stop:510 length:321 start_codon:yes stop_codon:yes gene_type:complete